MPQKVKFFSCGDEDVNEQRVNAWLEEHADVEVIDVKYVPTAGGDFTYSSCCIVYRDVKLERVETFRSVGIATLEIDVNVWLKEHAGEIEVLERKFAVCSVTDDEYHDRTISLYSYCIVYREK